MEQLLCESGSSKELREREAGTRANFKQQSLPLKLLITLQSHVHQNKQCYDRLTPHFTFLEARNPRSLPHFRFESSLHVRCPAYVMQQLESS
jgi:hypothetical protein